MPACPETERFAALLRSLKNRSGLSYEALAKRTGTAGSTLHRYCRGTSVPQDYGSVHRFATACGATPDELRTLHRQWALADAARTETGTGTGTESEAEAEAETGTEAAGDAVDPADAVVATDLVDGDDGDSDGDKESAAVEVGPVPPARQGRFRLDQFRQGRFRVVVIGAVVLTLGVSAWALTTDHPSSGSGGGSAADGRLLFSAACQPVVAMGQHDACVGEVQRLLHAKGADIDVDSDFGPQTLRRVTAFQVFTGLQPNGVVGDATKKALYTSNVRMTVWPPAKVRAHIRAVFTDAPDAAVAIADCQSFLDPLHILPNTNGTRNWGLFQISDLRLRELGGTPRQALDPEWNIRAAQRLWSKKRDFHDWPNCERAVKGAATTAPAR
ncbi:helix-turn-helix domain-containing protein [Streptomyces sp. RLB1-33]|uniref:helix-turn-helix domain-containing protein n=1 Tax=Streptomyces mirabilis TaxID=68239 RepID=UPI00143E206B|nr:MULTISPECIES: helix-turn-helix domain-containing protein [Streptomyces]QIY72953.1 helix-turn-helix domain-containing protein [Streptomyces sp. RLB1-33]QUW80084.1 helix-turn-helix domain-containing protein [Streptomyces mirabilis]